MKLLLFLFLSIIFPVEAHTNFYQQVEEGYEMYRVVIDYNNEYYQFTIIEGINNNELTYGVFFYNHKPSSDPHRLIIYKNGKEYRLETNNRHDINVPAIKLDESIEIIVFDSFGRKRGTTLTVEVVDIVEFRLYDDINVGDNMGIELTQLSRNFPPISFHLIIILVFVGIIVVFGSVILFLFFTKRGMFSEKKRIENVFNFREFVKTLYEQTEQQDEFRLRDDEFEEVKETKPVYERQRDYEDDEVVVDIKEILRNKGYNVDYQNATEIEKNEIMLELMKMRDFNEITSEQYQQEVIKLWSK